MGTSCAIISILAYTGYAAEYQKAIRNSVCSGTSSMLLYLFAGIMILAMVLLTLPFCSEAWTNFVLPTETELWAAQFGVNSVIADTVVSIFIMAIFYAIHIWNEAKARQSMNVGLYSIIFQVSSVVIIGLKQWFQWEDFKIYNYIGIAIVLLSSTLPLVHQIDKFDKKVIFISIISSFTAAVALFTDGEIVRQVIFKDNFDNQETSLFLFYEALTFLIPFTIVATFLFFKNSKVLSFNIFSEITTREKRNRYLWAAFASALQFIGAVFALAIDPKSLLPIGILSITPILGVSWEFFTRTNNNNTHQTRIEFIAAILVAFGLILLYKK
jgi:hypothetical protein